MILWRISNDADLSGTGGLLHAGRWHHRGGRSSIWPRARPARWSRRRCRCRPRRRPNCPPAASSSKSRPPDAAAIEDASSTLPLGWRERPDLTRALGSDWLGAQRSLLLRVPSAVVARSFNRLCNPLHPQAAACRVLSSARHPFDGRPLRRR